MNTHNGPQAGAKRTREMSLLYGGESILVQTLETKLQMKFDEYADQNQPNLWPSIPLNLSYGSWYLNLSNMICWELFSLFDST